MAADSWAEVLEGVRARLQEGTFRAWFSRLKPLGVEGDELVVGVPNRFFREWLSRRYGPLVARVAGEVLGRQVSVEFRLSGELFRELRGEQEGARHATARDARANQPGGRPSIPAFLEEVGWDAGHLGEIDELYAHGDALLLEAIEQYRAAERAGTSIIRPSAYFVGIVRRLSRQASRRRAPGVTELRVQLRPSWWKEDVE